MAADFGRAFYAFVAVQNAVKEGALYGAHYPLCDDLSALCPDPDNVTYRVRNEAKNQATNGLVPTIQCLDATTSVAHADLRDCVEGDTYVVTAAYQFRFLTPMISNALGSTTMIGPYSPLPICFVSLKCE